MKKIALITDGWGRYVTYTWIQGYRNYIAAHQSDMDLYIFQSFGNFSMDEKHNAGEYNIARLPDFSEFDGILLDLATVSQPDLIAEIIERTKLSDIPAISLLEQIPGLYHSGIDNYEAITRIVEHLITEHGCRTLNFIGGPEFNRENQLRFKAYRDALLRHGIPFDEQRVIHHNYEIETGIQAFSTFKKKNLLPDAFVCVNDNTAVGVCLAAKEAGLYTVFFPIDMTRASMKWSLDLLEHVADNGHMDALAIVDTMGVLAPHTVPYLVKAVKARIPGKPVELHFHDDYGLGAANTIMGLAAGADVAHTTIGAVGERAGNAPYEDVVLSLLTLYGVDLGLDYSQIYPLSKMLREFSGLQFRGNRGITGDTVFDIESGIVADWYMKSHDSDPLITNSYLPALTGHPDAKIVLGKHSGISSVDCYLAARKLDLTKEQKRLLVDAVKERAYEKHGLLDDADFDELAANICG